MKSINHDDIEIIESIDLSADETYIMTSWLKPLIYGLNPKKIRDELSIDLKDVVSIDIDGAQPIFAHLEAGPPNKDKDITFSMKNDYDSKIYDYPIIYPINKSALKVAKWLTLQCLFTKGLIRYPTYSNSLFNYFYIDVYDRNSSWHGIQSYQICCKNDHEICYKFSADTEKDLFTLTKDDVLCVSNFLNNPESPLHSHVSEDYNKGGEGPMFNTRTVLNRLNDIISTNIEAEGYLFPITFNEIAKYVDIVDLDRETSRSILFKSTINGVSNRTIDIFKYRDDDKFKELDKNIVIYPYSTLAVDIVKFVVLQELYARNYLKFTHDKINYTNGIESYWKLKYEEDEYVILNSENKVRFKLQTLPDQSILKFPVIEIRNGYVKGKDVVHDTKDISSCDYDDKKEEKEKERRGMFNHKFGKVRGSVLALSYDGKIAVKKANTEDYVRYNAETSTVENIKDLVINDNKWFFMIPATEVEVGDIIKYNDGFYQVIKVNEENISAINLMNSTMTTIVKETIFGLSCYAKVISLIDPSTFGDGNNGMMAMMMLGDDNMDIKELMMLQMITNGNKSGQTNPMMMLLMNDDMGGDDDMFSTMLIMNMMNGGNGFDMNNMFQNPMMMMMLLKDGDGKMDKMMKFMLINQMMNNQKAVEPAKEKEE